MDDSDGQEVPGIKVTCVFCTGVFGSIDRLKAHIKKQEAKGGKNEPHSILKFMTKISELMPIQCTRCKFTFTYDEFHIDSYDHAKVKFRPFF